MYATSKYLLTTYYVPVTVAIAGDTPLIFADFIAQCGEKPDKTG